MKVLVVMVILAAVLLGYLAMFLIATAPHDPEEWHVDPLVVPASDTPNDYRLAPEGSTSERIDAFSEVYAARPLVLAQAFDQFALSQRATVRIAGLPPELMMTYVQRTEKLKMPDYLTIKFIDLGDGTSTIAVYSRARYGYGDLGFNKARVERWVKSLDSFIGTAPAAPETGTDNG